MKMKIETLEVAGLRSALHGMRNPMDSWDKSDSAYEEIYDECNDIYIMDYVIGEKDLDLAQRLIKGGSEHGKYRRMIQVWCDITMPRYWWSEFDTYKIGTTANSCSTMHRLLNNVNPITLDMFVFRDEELDLMTTIVNQLESLRQEFRFSKDAEYKNSLLVRAKRLLPEGFLQKRTVNLNYETIANMYHQRKHHRLKEEWIDVFCTWVESLPYAQELIIYQG